MSATDDQRLERVPALRAGGTTARRCDIQGLVFT